jgi:putative hydrolase of the HAD superfamily
LITVLGQNDEMRGVLLDVGGVFLVPCRVPLVQTVGALIEGVSDAEFDRAHFEAIHALDVADVIGNEDRTIYLDAYLSSIGVPEDQLDDAIDTVVPLWNGPSSDLWRRVLSGSIDGLRALYDANLRLGIVSNSDGHAEEALVRGEICQVGPGDAVPVLTIVDSDIVGVAKPDPAIFQFALPTLGLDPSDVVYVGDSVKYDVRSAEAAGITPLHLDPFGLCDGVDHAHVTRVDEVLHDV